MKKGTFLLRAFPWVVYPALLLCWVAFLIWLSPPTKTVGMETALMKLQIEETKLNIQALKKELKLDASPL